MFDCAQLAANYVVARLLFHINQLILSPHGTQDANGGSAFGQDNKRKHILCSFFSGCRHARAVDNNATSADEEGRGLSVCLSAWPKWVPFEQ